jgi:hypothetical protein
VSAGWEGFPTAIWPSPRPAQLTGAGALSLISEGEGGEEGLRSLEPLVSAEFVFHVTQREISEAEIVCKNIT